MDTVAEQYEEVYDGSPAMWSDDYVMNFDEYYIEFVISLYITLSEKYIEEHSEDGIFDNLWAIENKDLEGTLEYLTREFLIWLDEHIREKKELKYNIEV